ncbi:hypothetical protein BDA96_08G135200 [Sorghum bicolor]|uniref:Uncharacterized protein n=1 Tax=Sorghum bicolor TaxID=4558 RepID=A0A921QHU1_SORBI|nr:hypothetical protein BDA96_08G135200 [Sorghum bicolor]
MASSSPTHMASASPPHHASLPQTHISPRRHSPMRADGVDHHGCTFSLDRHLVHPRVGTFLTYSTSTGSFQGPEIDSGRCWRKPTW